MLTAIGDVMRRVYERGWITTRDGNISMGKREGKYLYITPSGWRKTIVHPEHVVHIEIVTERWPSISWDKPTTASAQSRRTPGPPMNISSDSTTSARLS